MATMINNAMIEKAANRVIGLATTANDFALKTTEQAFTTAFDLTSKSVDFTAKAMKKGMEISASQHDMAFDMLGDIKKKFFKK